MSFLPNSYLPANRHPSVIHYTCLMSGCLRRKHYDQAWSAYELMKAGGVKPDATTLSTLLPGMVAAKSWDRVIALVKVSLAPNSPNKVPPETLRMALSNVQASEGHGRQAAELRELLHNAGMSVAPRRLQPARRQPGAA